MFISTPKLIINSPHTLYQPWQHQQFPIGVTEDDSRIQLWNAIHPWRIFKWCNLHCWREVHNNHWPLAGLTDWCRVWQLYHHLHGPYKLVFGNPLHGQHRKNYYWTQHGCSCDRLCMSQRLEGWIRCPLVETTPERNKQNLCKKNKTRKNFLFTKYSWCNSVRKTN